MQSLFAKLQLKRTQIIGLLFLISVFILPTPTLAQPGVGSELDRGEGGSQQQEDNFDPARDFSNLYEGTVNVDVSAAEVAGRFINTAVTYVGVIILVLIIYAGFLWVTAQGNQDKIETAKKILVGSIIGLVIIFSASAIVNFVISQIQSGVQ